MPNYVPTVPWNVNNASQAQPNLAGIASGLRQPPAPRNPMPNSANPTGMVGGGQYVPRPQSVTVQNINGQMTGVPSSTGQSWAPPNQSAGDAQAMEQGRISAMQAASQGMGGGGPISGAMGGGLPYGGRQQPPMLGGGGQQQSLVDPREYGGGYNAAGASSMFGVAPQNGPQLPQGRSGMDGGANLLQGSQQYGGPQMQQPMQQPAPAPSGGSNPYLGQQTQAVTDAANQNWRQNILPSINSGALANNNFGSNRHAIAQGVGAANLQNGLNNTIAQMNMGAWESDQNRALQGSMHGASLQNQFNIAQMGDATQRMGMGQNYSLGLGNLGLGFQNSGQNYALGMGGLANQAQGNANQFALGMGGLQNQSQANANNYALGLGSNQNQANANANNYALGLGNLGLGYTNAQNSYNLGLGQNQNQAQANANNYAIGMGGVNNQAQANQNNYNLGLGNLDYNYWNAGNNFNLQNTIAGQNFYTNQRGQDLQQLGLGANLFNQGNQGLQGQGQGLWGIGQQQQMSSWLPYQQFGSLLGPFSGLGGQQSQTQPGGSAWGNALGGALTAGQLWNLFQPR
ncbi:MAG TPA: hypothetical protein PKC59_02825 [Burkholderiaceae bacterium]|nr:hypothetical protein [Burkholderiaceae bacterium]